MHVIVNIMNQMHRRLTVLVIIFHYIPCVKTHGHSFLEALHLESTDVLRNLDLPTSQEFEFVIFENSIAMAHPQLILFSLSPVVYQSTRQKMSGIAILKIWCPNDVNRIRRCDVCRPCLLQTPSYPLDVTMAQRNRRTIIDIQIRMLYEKSI